MENITASLDDHSLLLTRTSVWSLWPWHSHYFLLLLFAYPLVTSFFRHDRLQKSRKTFHSTSLQHMTDDNAALIQQYLCELEFPFTYTKALQFALFRTYGIPSISKLLAGTSQFTNPETSSKRYVDTELLIREFVGHAPGSERTIEAISRMNYLHSKYRLSGQILDDDMLYTLSLFAGEPIKWINKYEWRQLEEFEKCAIGTFWKSMGDAMSISFDSLKSGKVGFRDGLHWLEEVLQWAEDYEKQKMVPHISNKITADETVSLLLWNIPPAMKGIGENLVRALMDARLRAAMMYPSPPAPYLMIVETVFTIRKFFLQYLSLPRPSFLRCHYMTTSPSKYGTYHSTKSDVAPYYIEPTLWRRWGPGAFLTRYMGLPVPGEEGDKYFPKGYKIVEIGPKGFQGKGGEEVKERVESLRRVRTGGCPFEKRV